MKIMSDYQEITGIQRVHPDLLYGEIRTAKRNAGKTNAQLAEESGVPIGYTNKYLSGAPVTLNLEYLAAYCVVLKIPIGDVLGVSQAIQRKPEDSAARLEMEIAHKEELLQERSKQVNLLQERSALMVAELERKEADMKSVRSSWKPVVYGLTGLCILLTAVLMVYMVLDAGNPDMGLIRSSGTSPVIYLAVLAAVGLCLFIGHCFVKHRKTKTRKEH